MPVINFSPEAKKASTNYDYPKLKLKSGEYARIVLLEDSPTVEYAHTLRAPQIVNGKPVFETAKRKNGDEYKAHKLDFLSKPLCLGDFAELENSGSDPKNCPMCAMARDFPDYTTAPQRRFAMHVIRYKTKVNGQQLVKPFSVEVQVWGFTDRTFNQIVDFKEEWGDLKRHDLILGPCENETFQKFDINIGAKAEWLADDERKKLTALTYKENQIPDLAIACGSRKERRWVDVDVETIKARWAVINGAAPTDEPGVSLDDALNDILDNDTIDVEIPGVSSTVEEVDADLDAILNTPTATEEEPDEEPDEPEAEEEPDEPEAEVAAPVKAATKPKAAAKPKAEPVAEIDVDDIDSLLANL